MTRRRALILVAAVIALVVGAVAGYVLSKRAEDIAGSSTEEFVPTDTPTSKPPPRPRPGSTSPLEEGIAWPTWGYTDDRVRISPYAHRPPFRVRWRFPGRQLLEFPPAVAFGRLYFSNNSGLTFAVRTKDGKLAWKRHARRCTASSPAVAGRTVYQAYLNRRPCNSSRSPFSLDGEVVAYDALTGKVRWRAKMGPTESSPLVVNGRVYVGDWRGDVIALDADTGRRIWSYRTGGRVKGAVAVSGRRLFVGAYDGHVYALNARTGRLLWRSSAQDRFGGRGNFYSTPAAAYGRVFIGNTDGKVYAFGATTGHLLWSSSTGGFVYSSPAVWRRLVFAGSYAGKVVALDAATGATRWDHRTDGPVSGAPTVMDGLVYVASLKERTVALDGRTGKLVWSFPDGKYTPIVADRDRAYLVGHTRVYALDPRRGQ
jgi:outer membrane protein assembly factor BamB